MEFRFFYNISNVVFYKILVLNSPILAFHSKR